MNLLSLNGDVVMTDEICLPESRFPGLTEAHLRERPSTLYALYQDVFGVNVIGTDERLRAAWRTAPRRAGWACRKASRCWKSGAWRTRTTGSRSSGGFHA